MNGVVTGIGSVLCLYQSGHNQMGQPLRGPDLALPLSWAPAPTSFVVHEPKGKMTHLSLQSAFWWDPSTETRSNHVQITFKCSNRRQSVAPSMLCGNVPCPHEERAPCRETLDCLCPSKFWFSGSIWSTDPTDSSIFSSVQSHHLQHLQSSHHHRQPPAAPSPPSHGLCRRTRCGAGDDRLHAWPGGSVRSRLR